MRKAGLALWIIVGLCVAVPLFIWFGCRVEVENGQIAVLIRKTGSELPPGEIIAREEGQQGIQLEVLGEGRYFRNPYIWDWQIKPITDVPAGSFAVLVRKYGKSLPAGELVAPDAESKGIVRELLGTGKHRINPYAYDVRLFSDIKIAPGNVGVVTSLAGDDVFTGASNDTKYHGGFLVAEGSKGVQSGVLKEGTHRINPFLTGVVVVNTQSQRHEFSGNDAINFLTLDGFQVSLEGTVEFNIDGSMAPRLAHEVGDMQDILKKLILPSVHGFARIEGSKKCATEFIIGESRQVFQAQLDKYLRDNCGKWGVIINSVLIRDIIVPQEIAEIIRNRELAKQEVRKYSEQIEQARSEAELKKQQMLAEQNRRKVAAETESLTAKINAQQKQLESRIAANTRLKVAEVDYKTAEADAKSAINAASAQQNVINEKNRADADVLKRRIKAYGNADYYVMAMLYGKLMPNLKSIMVNGGQSSTLGLPLSSGGAR